MFNFIITGAWSFRYTFSNNMTAYTFAPYGLAHWPETSGSTWARLPGDMRRQVIGLVNHTSNSGGMNWAHIRDYQGKIQILFKRNGN